MCRKGRANGNRIGGFVCALVLTLVMTFGLATGGALAEDTIKGTHSAVAYVPGEQLDVTNIVEYTGTLTAIGLVANIPAGWKFVGVTGDYVPAIQPPEGVTGPLEFGWVSPPSNVFTFTYTLAVPEGESGDKKIDSQVLYRRAAGQLTVAVVPDPLVLSGK